MIGRGTLGTMRDPIAFQDRRSRSYFEGWYFKIVSPSGEAIAFIPGISRDDDGTGHAFVQVIRGSDGATSYQRFPTEAFDAAEHPFRVTVGPNEFSRDGLTVDLPDAFGGIRGRLAFRSPREIGTSILRPGIMGWYRYVPRMECYHEVGSVDHRVEGVLEVAGAPWHLTGGHGYIEKDWGTSMPSAWVWLQCNTFGGHDSASLMVSIARIPWLGGSFPGFLGFVAPPGATDAAVVPFGTWSGARITDLRVADERVEIAIRARRWDLHIEGHRTHSGSLAAPVSGAMDRRIAESVDAGVRVRWEDHAGGVGWRGEGRSAGLEVVGDVADLARALDAE